MLDFKLSGENPVIVRYGEEPPPPGLLVQMEIDAEREVLALLSQGSEDSAQGVIGRSVATQAQVSASAFSVQLTPSIEAFVELNNWEI
ncbi:hypothetical protein [Streptomyces sp. NPDC088725]|uniref:hypothetical protein n=1 Tax=Streptomyces sp. NPDC088725 TaxID=3365873 RepID=UPI0037F4C848